MTSDPATEKHPLLARAGLIYVVVILALVGILQTINGLASVLDADFYTEPEHYAFDLDPEVWGWIHLVVGVLLLATAAGLYLGQVWAVVPAIGMTAISATVSFMYIPYYPVWGILAIALSIFAMWAVTRPGVFER